MVWLFNRTQLCWTLLKFDNILISVFFKCTWLDPTLVKMCNCAEFSARLCRMFSSPNILCMEDTFSPVCCFGFSIKDSRFSRIHDVYSRKRSHSGTCINCTCIMYHFAVPASGMHIGDYKLRYLFHQVGDDFQWHLVKNTIFQNGQRDLTTILCTSIINFTAARYNLSHVYGVAFCMHYGVTISSHVCCSQQTELFLVESILNIHKMICNQNIKYSLMQTFIKKAILI